MRIVIVGSGAMGALFGARFSATGHHVTLYDTWQEHVDAINRNGLSIEGLDGATVVRYRIPASATPPEEIETAELVLVMVKAYDTFNALKPLADRIAPAAFVLSLQNGLGNLEQIRAALPGHDRILIGTTAHGSTVVSPGRIRHAGKGMTTFGDPTLPATPRFPLTGLRNTFQKAGFETQLATNVYSAIWAKLVSNVAINPISALTGLRNGELLHDPDVVTIVEQVVSETVAVMQAAGVPAVADDYLRHARDVMEGTHDNLSSMLQDIRRGRRTEIDAINGAVVRLGDELGVPVPTNRWLAAFVRHREADARRLMTGNG
jgi:2-dehydropantoate 2-reductase